MRDVTIGRLLVASLHQGIADVLPMRLTFYEEWLNAEGLRVGTIGAAAVFAVLSFLRQEGEAYEVITARAGQYAAEWMVQKGIKLFGIDCITVDLPTPLRPKGFDFPVHRTLLGNDVLIAENVTNLRSILG